MVAQHPLHPGTMRKESLISQMGDVSKAAIPTDAQTSLT